MRNILRGGNWEFFRYNKVSVFYRGENKAETPSPLYGFRIVLKRAL